jgi:hypothetical protein
MFHMSKLSLILAPFAAGAIVMAAQNQVSANEGTAARTVRLNGAAQKVGNGTTRAYLIVDQTSGVPLEIGVALSEGAMENLPAPMKMTPEQMQSMEHMDMQTWVLDLPTRNPTPYKFVTFGWNPQGHEPPGVWDIPHFDFHFYTASKEVRAAIVPSNPDFAAKAEKYPAESSQAQYYIDAATATKLPRTAMTVPEMGMHWFDVRTPEIQALAGKPEAYKKFTRTFLYGSWDGEFIFAEPMITREYLLNIKAREGDDLVAVPAAKFTEPGMYPQAYRIKYDAKAREYRIALTNFAPTR